MRHVIFDFDHTLFNAELFVRQVLPQALQVDQAGFVQDYLENFRARSRPFSLEPVLAQYGLDRAELARRIGRNIEICLADGAGRLLDHFRSSMQAGDEMILLSFGERAWQELKINSLTVDGRPLRGYFDRVVIEEGRKADGQLLCSLAGEIVIVNDNERESLAMMERCGAGRTRVYLVKSVHSNNAGQGAASGIERFDSLAELDARLFPEA